MHLYLMDSFPSGVKARVHVRVAWSSGSLCRWQMRLRTGGSSALNRMIEPPRSAHTVLPLAQPTPITEFRIHPAVGAFSHSRLLNCLPRGALTDRVGCHQPAAAPPLAAARKI